MKLNDITSTIIGSAIKIHRALGPGLLELFCLNWTLSFNDVLEFSTQIKEKLNVEKELFNA